jgi:hypothetical protein
MHRMMARDLRPLAMNRARRSNTGGSLAFEGLRRRSARAMPRRRPSATEAPRCDAQGIGRFMQ